jgi:hypothetical protein
MARVRRNATRSLVRASPSGWVVFHIRPRWGQGSVGSHIGVLSEGRPRPADTGMLWPRPRYRLSEARLSARDQAPCSRSTVQFELSGFGRPGVIRCLDRLQSPTEQVVHHADDHGCRLPS